MEIKHILEIIGVKGHYFTSKHIAYYFQSMDVSVVFAEMLEQHSIKNKVCGVEWCPMTYEEMAQRTWFTFNKVKDCVQRLLEKGLFETKRIGIPSKVYYKLNCELLETIFNNEASAEKGLDTRPDKNLEAKDKEIKDKETEDKGKDSLSSVGSTDVVPQRVVLQRRKPKEPSLFPSDDVADCFNHWNDLGFPLSKHKLDPESKTFRQSISGINLALRKHTKEKIIQAMTDYKNLLLSKQTWLTLSGIGHKVPLYEFFRFTKRTEDAMATARIPLDIESWFDEGLKGFDHLERKFGRYEHDPNPKMTEAIKTSYCQKVISRKFSVADENCFIRASKFVLEYHGKHKNNINWSSCLAEKNNPTLFARRLVDAVIEDTMNVDNTIEPSWLCSPRTINSRFPKYMRKHGLMNQEVIKAKPEVKRMKPAYDPGYRPGEIE